MEPCAFIEKLLSMNLKDQEDIFGALPERYKVDHNNEKLLQESEWLKSVQDLLQKEAHNRKGKLSGYKLEQLNKGYLEGIIEKLEAVKAQPN
jgi:hypothetical protein